MNQSLENMTLRDYFAAKAMQGFLATGKSDYLDNIFKSIFKVGFCHSVDITVGVNGH